MTNNQACADTSSEGVFSSVTNDDFIKAVFPTLPEQAFAAICTKHGNPHTGGYKAQRADQATTNLAPL